VRLTFIKNATESTADAWDQYIGLDRFWRVVDRRWIQPCTQAEVRPSREHPGGGAT
jgi:hypothetical protein